MKEKICENILQRREYDKWYDIINDSVRQEPSIMKYERKEETSTTKSEYIIKVGGLHYYLGEDIEVLTEHIRQYKWTDTVKDGWFKTKNIEHWSYDDYPLNHQEVLFIFSIEDKSITVYKEDVYEFCKKLGKKYKLKTLYKCWDDAE